MRKNRLSNADVAALLDGTTPLGHPELESVATLVDDLRLTSFEAPPRPTAELASRLDLDRASWISPAAGGLLQKTDRATTREFAAPAPKRGKARMIFTWFAGLGLAAKIGMGATAVAFGAVGAGAAHALPTPVQHSFDVVVDALTSHEDAPVVDDSSVSGDTATDTVPVTETGTETVVTTTDPATTLDPAAPVSDDGTDDSDDSDHAAGVQEAAHDDSVDGREHGQAVSDAAHQNRGQGSDDFAEHDAHDDSSTGVDDSSDDDSSHGGSSWGSSSSGSGHQSGKNKN
jgi:hypothetical protein